MLRFSRRLALAGLVAAGASIFAVAIHRHHPIDGWISFATCGRRCSPLSFAHRASWRVMPSWFACSAVCFRSTNTWQSPRRSASFCFFSRASCGSARTLRVALFLSGPRWAHRMGCSRLPAHREQPRPHSARLDLRLSLDPIRAAVLAFGCLGTLLLWLTILTPQNASYDARWYHLPIAEHYVAQGRIAPFSEGSWSEPNRNSPVCSMRGHSLCPAISSTAWKPPPTSSSRSSS